MFFAPEDLDEARESLRSARLTREIIANGPNPDPSLLLSMDMIIEGLRRDASGLRRTLEELEVGGE